MVNGTKVMELAANLPWLAIFDEVTIYTKSYIPIVFIVMGIVGNVVTLIVFIRQKSWHKQGLHYLFCLALTDLGCIVFQAVPVWLEDGLRDMTGARFYLSIITSSSVVCKILRYLWTVSTFMSSWIIVAFTVERTIAVLKPLHAYKFSSVKRRKTVLAAMFVVCASIVVVYVFTFNTYYNDDQMVCLLDNRLQGTILYTISVIMYAFGVYIIPCFALTVLNLTIISVVRSGMAASINESAATKHRSLTINLLLISSLFTVLMVPSAIGWAAFFLLRKGLTPLDNRRFVNLNQFLTVISQANYSTNFIIYARRFDFFVPTVRAIVRCRRCYGVPKNTGPAKEDSSRDVKN
ncbi:galanin receptor type 1-like [Tubulanus polymorphus]|uniref:galanin receptor type 1-like n=1 Tax=Tubulanus polymorphus TaxID=672921 RepID=UPI003DA1DFC9